MATLLFILPVLISGLCILERRTAWRHPLEVGSNFVGLAMFAAILLVVPPAGHVWGRAFHAITQLWNVEQLVAHLFYLTGLVILARILVNRTNIEDPERHLAVRLNIPLNLGVPLAVALFIHAAPDQHCHDILACNAGDPWLTAYWLNLAGLSLWLIWCIIPALLVVRKDPRSRAVANIYLTALSIDVLFNFSLVLSRFSEDYPHGLSWTLMLGSAVLYSLAPACSWRHRRHWITCL